MNSLLLKLCLIPLLLQCTTVSGPRKTMPKGIVKLHGPASEDFSDLRELANRLNTVRIVGLGESVHTSHGFYSYKFRLIRFLVKEMGFRAIGVESQWLRSEPASRYVSGGAGTLSESLSSLSPIFNDRDVASMLEWLRAWNLNHPADKVEFFGFENGGDSFGEWKLIKDFLKNNPKEKEFLDSIDSCVGSTAISESDFFGLHAFISCNRESADRSYRFEKKDFNTCSSALDRLATAFQETAPKKVQIAVQALKFENRSYYYWGQFLKTPSMETLSKWFSSRDESMARTAQAINEVNNESRKMILWAHNGHIAKSNSELKIPNYNLMGMILSKEYRKSYFPIGFIAYKTGFHLIGKNYRPEFSKADDSSLESNLNQIGVEYALLDLRNKDIEDFLQSKFGGFSLAIIPPTKISKTPLSSFFSFVIFMQSSAPMMRQIQHHHEDL